MNGRLIATLLLLAALVVACARENDIAPPPPGDPPPPPDVVLLVGDGFGVGAWSLARELAAARGERLRLEEPDELGFLDARCADYLVTDSAAAATAWSLGLPGRRFVVGLPGERTLHERLADAGRAFGIVTTSRLTHATPAPFYGRAGDRHEEDLLAEQLVLSRPDVALGGGLRHFRPAGTGGRRSDGRDLVAEAESAGTAVQLRFSAPLPLDRPVLGLYAASHLPHELDRDGGPDLADLAVAAIRRLEATTRSWFLVIEEARIDSAAHDHDGPGIATNTLRLDRALAAVLDEVPLERTLVVLVADHATDSPAWMEYAHPESLEVVSMSVERMEQLVFGGEPWSGTPRALERKALPVIDTGARHTGLSAADLDRLVTAESVYDRRTALGHAISRRFGISFVPYEDHLASTEVHGHTAEPVPVRAWGAGAEGVRGVHDHAELGRWLHDVMGLPTRGGEEEPEAAGAEGATAGP